MMEMLSPIQMKICKMFPMIDGLFAKINYQFPEVFGITNQEMDMLFVSGYGMRNIAPIVVVAYHQSEIDYLSILASLILHTYKYKWDKMAALVNLEYDPIHNYSDTYHEELSEGIESTENKENSNTESSNETVNTDTVVTDGGTERKVYSNQDAKTRTDNLSEEINATGENNLYGFNSNDAVGADTDASHRTRTNTGTQGTSGTGSGESTVYGGLTHTTDGTVAANGGKSASGTEDISKNSDRQRTRDFTHLGNIGNITTQQLVQQEIELWRWNFIQEVLNDVKDFLTIPVYD